MDENRKKALAAALTQIEKQFGKGSVMRMGDGTAVRDIEAVSTGSLTLDIALGIGGIPKGRVIEIYGPESCESESSVPLKIFDESEIYTSLMNTRLRNKAHAQSQNKSKI